MNYCEIIKKLSADPKIKMSVHFGRVMTVRDMLELKAHVANCSDCQVLLDALLEKYPQKEEFYKGEPN